MIKKIFISLAVILVLLLGAAIAVPYIFKDKILAKVKTTINDNVNAKVDFGNFDISLLKNFPNLSFELENLSVVGVDTFANDTLANIAELGFTVDLMSVINGGTINIKSVNLNKPNLNIKVLANGMANYDIAKADTATTAADTGSTSFKATLQKYTITDANIIYDDASLGVYTSIKNMDHVGTGDFTQDIFTLNTKTTAEALTVKYGGVSYLNEVKADIDFPVEIDLPKSKYTFTDNKAQINDLILNFKGFVEMPTDDIKMDIVFSTDKAEFKSLLSLIPAIYASSFEDLTASGKFEMKGYAKGIYNEKQMPAFGVDMAVENGKFKYPDLPVGVNNVQIATKITNPDGDLDHTVINVSKFHMDLGTEPFDAKLMLLTPISDPNIDMTVKGKIDLANVTKIVPIPDTKLSGIINADVTAAGRMSSIEKEQYQDFKAAGQITVNNLSYTSKDLPETFSISQTQATFTPKNITLVGFDGKMGKSDFKMNGTLNNYIAYALKGDPIAGKLDFSSNLLDVNQLMGTETTTSSTTTDTAALTVVEVPANVNFVLTSSVSKILYDNMVLENLKGVVTVANSTLSFKDVALNTLGASMKMNGSYNTTNPKEPISDLVLSIQNMDIQKAFTTFNTVQAMAPIAKFTQGMFSGDINLKMALGADMMPKLNTITGSGALNILKAVVEGFQPLNKLAEAIKLDKYKKLELANVLMKMKFENGRINIEPMDIKQGALAMNIGGSSGFDQSLAYVAKIALPKSEMGAAANNVMTGLANKANANGANVSLGEVINVNAIIGGTVTKPEIKLSMGDLKGTVKDAVKDIIDNKKAELEAKGRAEVDKLKAEGEAKARAEADRLKAEAEAKKAEAEARARAEAEKAKKEAENKLKEELKKKIPGFKRP